MIFKYPLIPPLVLICLSSAFLLIAASQPAWLSANHIGPGFFAQGIAGLALLLSVFWLVMTWVGSHRTAKTCAAKGATTLVWPGITLLGSVVSFLVLMPLIGLVLACAVTATLAARGAGERAFLPLALSFGIAFALTAGVGLTLLPPTTQLWPWLPYGPTGL